MPGERRGVLGNKRIKLAAVLQIQPYKEYYFYPQQRMQRPTLRYFTFGSL